MKQNLNISAGELFVMTGGEYSDYCIDGHFLALVDISEETFRQAHSNAKARAAEEYGEHMADMEADEFFLAELTKMGVMAEIAIKEIHYKSYDGVTLFDKTGV